LKSSSEFTSTFSESRNAGAYLLTQDQSGAPLSYLHDRLRFCSVEMFVGVGEYLSLSGNPDSTRTIRFCLRGSGLQCVGLGSNNAYLPLRVFRNADRTQVTDNSSSARTFLLHCRNGQICEAVIAKRGNRSNHESASSAKFSSLQFLRSH